MDPDLRNALLGLGIGFCALFGLLTLYAAVKLGFGLSNYGDLLSLGFLLISLAGDRDDHGGPGRRDPQSTRRVDPPRRAICSRLGHRPPPELRNDVSGGRWGRGGLLEQEALRERLRWRASTATRCV